MIRLSKRERQILVAIALGQSPAQMAAEMQLSVKTVSTYRARIVGKIGVKSNAGLAVLAYQCGLIPGFQSDKIKLFKETNSARSKPVRRKTQPGIDNVAGSVGESPAE
jgi:DNA-binding CsgD family transcriptional regulator